MRDTTVSKSTLFVVAALVVVAALFAWVRSRRPAPRTSEETAATGETAPPAGQVGPPTTGEVPVSDGQAVYADECGFCHGADAEARSSLGARVARMSRVDGGDDYLIDLLLYGLEGEIEDEPAHAPFDHLTDAQIVAVIEYLRRASRQAGPEAEGPAGRAAVSVAAVEARRSRDLDAGQVSAERRRVLDAVDRGRR